MCDLNANFATNLNTFRRFVLINNTFIDILLNYLIVVSKIVYIVILRMSSFKINLYLDKARSESHELAGTLMCHFIQLKMCFQMLLDRRLSRGIKLF